MSLGLLFSRRTHGRQQRETTALHNILKKVSRSFYLSLHILPHNLRKQISLAYLFCRVADTIADSRFFPPHQQHQTLEAFRRQFLLDAPSFTEIEHLTRGLDDPPEAHRGERDLLQHLADCFLLLMELPPPDRQLIRELVLALTQGMHMDLTYFASTPTSGLRTLPDFAALDLYTYYVAGTVGEFWTKLHRAYMPAWQHGTGSHLCALGVRFGKGLQMTNILKDLGKDLALGRCYLPKAQLEQLGLSADELRLPGALPKVRPLLLHLTWHTIRHLDAGYRYILLLPRSALRSRLSCMWPLLFALQTLDATWHAEHLLLPDSRIKISRSVVYRTILLSLGCLAHPHIFAKYYAFLRQRLTLALDAYQAPSIHLSIP